MNGDVEVHAVSRVVVYEAARAVFDGARAARPRVTLAGMPDLRRRFGLGDMNPTTERTMTEERMARIELVEKQADGDLLRDMLAFAAERIMKLER